MSSTNPYLTADHIQQLMSQSSGKAIQIHRFKTYPIDNSASILVTLTAQQSESLIGHFGIELSGEADGQAFDHKLVLKIKPHGREIADMLAGLAQLSDPMLGEVYGKHHQSTGFYQTHLREIAVYEQLPHPIQPRIYGLLCNQKTNEYQLLMDDLTGYKLLNSVMQPEKWQDVDIHLAVRGMAQWHAFARHKLDLLPQAAWADTDKAHYWVQEAGLWQILLDKAIERFPESYPESLRHALREGLEHIHELAQDFHQLPHTLIHNDANPRNSCFKPDGSFCLYDWELSCRHVPVYDAIEFLSFVCTERNFAQIPDYLAIYRKALVAEWPFWANDQAWQQALKLAWLHFGWHRLGMYMMANAVAPYPFLNRVFEAYHAVWNTAIRR
ncbi:MAG: phosphotransferase [Bacteroidia bacterium]